MSLLASTSSLKQTCIFWGKLASHIQFFLPIVTYMFFLHILMYMFFLHILMHTFSYLYSRICFLTYTHVYVFLKYTHVSICTHASARVWKEVYSQRCSTLTIIQSSITCVHTYIPYHVHTCKELHAVRCIHTITENALVKTLAKFPDASEY